MCPGPMDAASCGSPPPSPSPPPKAGQKEEAVANAEAALYEAKRRGKNCTVGAGNSSGERAEGRVRLTNGPTR